MKISPAELLLFSLAFFISASVVLGSLALVLSDDSYLLSLAASTNTIQDSDLKVGFTVSAATTSRILSEDVIAYVKGAKAALQYSSYYGHEEVSHLADVRNKISVLFKLLYSSIAASLALAFFLLFLSGGQRNFAIQFRKALLVSAATTSVLLLFAFLASLSFDLSFTAFHKVFFGASSQWEFPSGYLIVNLFTEDFFAAAATAIFVRILIFSLILGIVSFALGRVRKWMPR